MILTALAAAAVAASGHPRAAPRLCATGVNGDWIVTGYQFPEFPGAAALTEEQAKSHVGARISLGPHRAVFAGKTCIVRKVSKELDDLPGKPPGYPLGVGYQCDNDIWGLGLYVGASCQQIRGLDEGVVFILKRRRPGR